MPGFNLFNNRFSFVKYWFFCSNSSVFCSVVGRKMFGILVFERAILSVD